METVFSCAEVANFQTAVEDAYTFVIQHNEEASQIILCAICTKRLHAGIAEMLAMPGEIGSLTLQNPVNDFGAVLCSGCTKKLYTDMSLALRKR